MTLIIDHKGQGDIWFAMVDYTGAYVKAQIRIQPSSELVQPRSEFGFGLAQIRIPELTIINDERFGSGPDQF